MLVPRVSAVVSDAAGMHIACTHWQWQFLLFMFNHIRAHVKEAAVSLVQAASAAYFDELVLIDESMWSCLYMMWVVLCPLSCLGCKLLWLEAILIAHTAEQAKRHPLLVNS